MHLEWRCVSMAEQDHNQTYFLVEVVLTMASSLVFINDNQLLLVMFPSSIKQTVKLTHIGQILALSWSHTLWSPKTQHGAATVCISWRHSWGWGGGLGAHLFGRSMSMCQCLSNIIDWGSGERSSLAWFPAQEKPLTTVGRRGGAEPDFSGGTSLFCLVEVSPKGSAVAAVDEKTLDMIIGCFSSTGNIQ